MAGKPSKEPAPSKVSAADQFDRDLARRALEKIRLGQSPSAQERAALKRVEKQRDEELRWQHYRTIPQKHWIEMSGRQAKVINDQADRYKIPFDGAKVDLPAVVKALHDFLSANAAKLNAEIPEDGGPDSPMLERKREEEWLMTRMKRLQMEGELIPRDKITNGFGQVAALIKRAGAILQKRYGPEAVNPLDEALESAVRIIEELFTHE